MVVVPCCPSDLVVARTPTRRQASGGGPPPQIPRRTRQPHPPVCDVVAPVGAVPAVTRAGHHFKQALRGGMTRGDSNRRCTTPGCLARRGGGPCTSSSSSRYSKSRSSIESK